MGSIKKVVFEVGGAELSLSLSLEDWLRMKASVDRQFGDVDRYDPSTCEGRENLRHREMLQTRRAIAAEEAAYKAEIAPLLREIAEWRHIQRVGAGFGF